MRGRYPGFASQNALAEFLALAEVAAFASGRSLPRFAPSGHSLFPRLQLRVSAGFAPASRITPTEGATHRKMLLERHEHYGSTALITILSLDGWLKSTFAVAGLWACLRIKCKIHHGGTETRSVTEGL